MSALANSTSSSNGSIRPIRNPLVEPPARFERVPKAVGSMKLVGGRWVEVLPDDEDAIKEPVQ